MGRKSRFVSVKLRIKPTSDYRAVIEQCYANDPELLEKYHILAPTDCESAVNDTVLRFVHAQASSKFTMICLYDGNNFFGYFCIDSRGNDWLLCGFFIMPEYRTSTFIEKFWRVVMQYSLKHPLWGKSAQSLYCGLYKQNTRAGQFLEKKGFCLTEKIPSISENKIINLYKFN